MLHIFILYAIAQIYYGKIIFSPVSVLDINAKRNIFYSVTNQDQFRIRSVI